MPTRTFDIPPRGHSLGAGLHEITEAGGVAVRVELAPQTPFAGDPEFDSTDLSDWTIGNSGSGASDAHTTKMSHLFVDLNATSGGWNTGSRSSYFVYQVLSGDFDVYARVAFGELGRNFHAIELVVQSTTDATDWVKMNAFTSTGAPHLSFTGDNVQNDVSLGVLGSAALSNRETAGAPLYLRLKRSGDDITGYYGFDGKNWTAIGAAVTRSDIPASVNVGIAFSTNNTSNLAKMSCDFLRTWPPYVTTSPVSSVVIDSGVAGTVWDMSTFDALVNAYVEDAGYRATVGAGTLKFKYGASDTNPPSLNASYLTEAQLQSESDPSGRYFKLEVQYISANGYELASFNGATIDASFAMAGAGRGVMRGM